MRLVSPRPLFALRGIDESCTTPPQLIPTEGRARSAGQKRLLRRAPMLTPPKLRELRHPDWRVDVDEVARATGWEPAIKLREGLEQLRNSAL